MKDFYRVGMFRKHRYGLDSIQGFLEMANWYNDGPTRFVFRAEKEKRSYDPVSTLKQLEKEGYKFVFLSQVVE